MEPYKITIHIWTPSSTFQEHRLVASWKGPVAVSLGNVGTSSPLQLSAGGGGEQVSSQHGMSLQRQGCDVHREGSLNWGVGLLGWRVSTDHRAWLPRDL